MLKQSEHESLENTELVRNMLETIEEERLRKRQKDSPSRKHDFSMRRLSGSSSQRDFDADRRELLQEAIDRAFASMLKEAEVTYLVNVLKDQQ